MTTIALEPAATMPPVNASPGLEVARGSASLAHLQFTGGAAEYWRIWIVHLTLNVLTLGLYSPWAKLRKMRWFARHTLLLGDAFDYQADPWRLLRGRVLALLLLLGYGHLFEFSLTAGLVFYALVLALGPLMFASAQRFKLRASSWRGMRFDFHAGTRQSYAVVLPFQALWMAPAVAVQFTEFSGWWWALGALPFLLLPWAHARFKTFQHSEASFLGLRFQCDPITERVYSNYLLGLGLVLLTGIVVAVTGALLAPMFEGRADDKGGHIVLGSMLGMLCFYLLVWPMFAARMQRVAWENTCWANVQFRCELDARRACGLLLRHGPLVLLSLGLWWPVAAVAWARLRVEAISLSCQGDLEAMLNAARPAGLQLAAGAASADAAAELFDLDLGW